MENKNMFTILRPLTLGVIAAIALVGTSPVFSSTPPSIGVTIDHGDTPHGGVDGRMRRKARNLTVITANPVTIRLVDSDEKASSPVSPP